MSYATDRLIKNARIALPGSIDGAILLELFNVLDQFFRESGVWTEDIPFIVAANDPAGTIYYIEPESVSTIVRLIWVFDGNAFGQRAVMDIPGEVTFLTPAVSSTNDYVYTASVVLSVVDPMQRDGYPEFPEWVLVKYGNGILHGLMGRMMAQPAKPYTNAELAKAHLAGFRRAISIAVTESTHRNVHNGQAWRFPQHFSTRRR